MTTTTTPKKRRQQRREAATDFAARRLALLQELRQTTDLEQRGILLEALDLVRLNEAKDRLERATDAKSQAVKRARRAERRLQTTQQAVAAGTGTVAQVQAAEVALAEAAATEREAAIARWLCAETVWRNQAARREAAHR